MATETPLLDPAFKKQVDRSLVRLHRLMGALEKMQACGVECDEYRAVAQHLVADLDTINAIIFKEQKGG